MGTTVSKKSPNSSPPPVSNGASHPPIRRSESESHQMSRKLWWSPKQNRVELIRNESVEYRNVRAKVGSLANIEYRPGGGQVAIRDEPMQWQASPRIDSLSNANWLPSAPRVSVRQEKLKWNAQSKVNSLDNVNHKPGGGIVEIYDEKLDFKHVTPRVNTGFVD